MFLGTGQTVDCAVDLVGIPTDVATVGNERWLGIFLRFKRQLTDPRTDGNSQQVLFRRDESFELVVRQAPEGAIGVAPKPALQADELLLCDVRRRPGQTQILVADIDTSRRQAFIFAQGTSVSVVTGTWSILRHLRRRCKPRISEERVDPTEVASIVTEAAAARNGWKVILARCAPKTKPTASDRQGSRRRDGAPAINSSIAARDHADARDLARPALHARRRDRSSRLASLRPDDQQARPRRGRRSC